MSGPKIYFLLTEPIPGQRLLDLLGRAVYIDGDSLKHPTTSSVIKPDLPTGGPDEPDLKLLTKGLYPTHVEAKDAEMLREKASDAGIKASIENALAVFYQRKKATQVKKSMPGFRRITMEGQFTKIQSLLEKEEYSKPIIDWFQKDPKARFGVIVSIISCFEMELGKEESKEHTAGASVQTEGMEALGGLDKVALKMHAGNSIKAELSGTYKDEVIIACGYVEMKLKESPGGWQFWKSHKPSPYDVTFTSQSIHPATMTVSAPPTRMEGDQEAILGGVADGDGEEAADTNLPEPLGQGDEDSDFVICG